MKPIKKLNLTRRQKIGSCLGVVGFLILTAIRFVWYELDQFDAEWTSTKVTASRVSPDGAYVATVTDWNAGALGGGSNLKVTSVKPSSFSVRFSRLFSGSYSDSFEEINGIQWTGKRTLNVKYADVPGEGNHSHFWGDVRFDYKPISIK